MRLIPDSENIIKNKSLTQGENSEICTQEKSYNAHYFNQLNQEAAELLMRLNKLANSYPFNILYRYKDNMHDMR